MYITFDELQAPLPVGTSLESLGRNFYERQAFVLRKLSSNSGPGGPHTPGRFFDFDLLPEARRVRVLRKHIGRIWHRVDDLVAQKGSIMSFDGKSQYDLDLLARTYTVGHLDVISPVPARFASVTATRPIRRGSHSELSIVTETRIVQQEPGGEDVDRYECVSTVELHEPTPTCSALFLRVMREISVAKSSSGLLNLMGEDVTLTWNSHLMRRLIRSQLWKSACFPSVRESSTGPKFPAERLALACVTSLHAVEREPIEGTTKMRYFFERGNIQIGEQNPTTLPLDSDFRSAT